MKKRLLKITSLFLAVCILLSSFSMSALALSWDGSSTGGGGEGGAATTKGFSIRFTDDRNCLGYRFSVVDKAGGTRNGISIDVYRNTQYGNSEFTAAYKYTVKYNKKQLIDNQNNSFSTSKITSYCYKEADMGFTSSLPAPDGMETWQQYTGNLNPILSKLSIGTTDSLKNGDKLLVEPLYNVRLQTIYHSVTTTELAIYGKWLLGANSDGGSSGNSDTWGFISAYTNRYYPNALYTPDGQGLWTGVSALTKRATFYDIINKGYGVGIAYTETRPDFTPSLKVNVCEAWKGAKSTRSFHYGTSNGSSFSNYSYDKGYPIKGDTALSRLNAFLDSELEQLLCFDTEIDAEIFCNQKSAIFLIMPEEDPSTFFMVSLLIQQLYREILAVADENGGKLKNRCVFFADEFGTLPKIESAEMMFSASRSRRLQIVPIIQSFSQLEKNYGKEGAEIIVDNTQLTIFGGFAPNSSSAEVLSKALGSRTVQTGSVSIGKNDPSQSIQMIERPLLTADELKSLPKGRFVVMKTGYHPMQVNLKLFFKWGITFDGEPYMVEDRGNRKVAYADKAEIVKAILKKYHPERETEEPPIGSVLPGGGMQATEWNEPNGRSRSRSVGRLHTGPREIQGSQPFVPPPPRPEVQEDGQA